MKRMLYLIIAAIVLSGCAVLTAKPPAQAADKPVKKAPELVLQDELLNEPPEQPRFVIAQSPAADAVDQALVQVIRQQLPRLGYMEAQSRDQANVLVWYRYTTTQTGEHIVGQATDPWGEKPVSADTATLDLNSMQPVSFSVQLVALQESQFPDRVMTIWQGDWSRSTPDESMQKFSQDTLVQVFERYLSEPTQNQLAAFRQARERKLQRAINTYMSMVMYRIQSHWKKPTHHVKGKQCQVKIVQSMVGEIKSHKLLRCDRDRRFRSSIEKAIKASSPLPMPEEELFDRRELILIFQG